MNPDGKPTTVSQIRQNIRRVAAENAQRRRDHEAAIEAYDAAQAALKAARKLVDYLETEVWRTHEVAASFMPPEEAEHAETP